MKTYLIRLYTADGRAKFDKRDALVFGERNEGVQIDADDKAAAVALFNSGFLPGHRYNPFYLKIEEI